MYWKRCTVVVRSCQLVFVRQQGWGDMPPSLYKIPFFVPVLFIVSGEFPSQNLSKQCPFCAHHSPDEREIDYNVDMHIQSEALSVCGCPLLLCANSIQLNKQLWVFGWLMFPWVWLLRLHKYLQTQFFSKKWMPILLQFLGLNMI